MPHDDTEPLGVTPKQAWRMLSCSNSTGYLLLADGELESYHVGRGRRILVSSIKRFVERQLGNDPSAPAGRQRGAR
jgi:excisionase family DNA binding protein